MNAQFPKTIKVVQRNLEEDNPYLMVIEDDSELEENGEAIATYEKVSTGRVKITKEIV